METPSWSDRDPGSLVQDVVEPDNGNVTRALQDLGYVDSDIFRVIDSASDVAVHIILSLNPHLRYFRS